jgi:hypothetical protein
MTATAFLLRLLAAFLLLRVADVLTATRRGWCRAAHRGKISALLALR